jgi:histidine triad (HIT) family protein
MDDCVFCNIVNRVVASEILFEDDQIFVVRDIMPKAPVHLLVIPKEHINSVNELTKEHQQLIGNLILIAKEQAVAQGVAESGYKLVFNVGKDGGQVIPHLHLHIVGGKVLGA